MARNPVATGAPSPIAAPPRAPGPPCAAPSPPS